MKHTEAQLLIEHHLDELGLKPWEAEYRFHPTRKWRFDYAVPHMMIAIEIEGGIFPSRNVRGEMVTGAHVRGKHYQSDLDKYNSATFWGWSVFRFSVQDVKLARDVELLRNWRVRAIQKAYGKEVADEVRQRLFEEGAA
jgi:hypothetical protein